MKIFIKTVPYKHFSAGGAACVGDKVQPATSGVSSQYQVIST